MHRDSWIGLGALLAATCLAQVPSRRVAIRVDADHVAFAESLALDVWSEDRAPGMPLDLVVSSDHLLAIGSYEVLDPDIDATAAAERERVSASMMRPGDWFADYKDYRAISEHLQALAAEAPARASVRGIGSSLDGRTIWALRIGGTAPDAVPMLIDGTQHAREWIAAMTTTCVADRLIHDYDRDPRVRDFVDHTALWVVPVVNPDGYQWSWSADRYWRKNRRDGHGVDLNRNFSVAWGGAGSSGIKRSEIYRGTRELSEPESAALVELAMKERPKLHVDFHSYSQLVLYPWGYTGTRTKDHARFGAIGDAMASAMYAQHGTAYKLMQSVQLYPASGTATDFMYGEAGALSYTIELRPKGGSGFVLPPEQIRPTCDEGSPPCSRCARLTRRPGTLRTRARRACPCRRTRSR
jgi:murein tripeptide amidase MpaA